MVAHKAQGGGGFAVDGPADDFRVAAFAFRQRRRQLLGALCPAPSAGGIAALQQRARLGAVGEREIRIGSQGVVHQSVRAGLQREEPGHGGVVAFHRQRRGCRNRLVEAVLEQAPYAPSRS